jgi:hypothetical protein
MAKAANGIFENNPALTKANEEWDEEQTVENTEASALDEELPESEEESGEEYFEEDFANAGLNDIASYFIAEDFSEEMAKLEEDLMAEMGLDELTEEFMNVSDMDVADLKELKLKHRLKEQKEIAEADAAYLKAVFEQMAKERASGSVSVAMNASSTGMGAAEVSSAPTAVSFGGASFEAPAFDVFA